MNENLRARTLGHCLCLLVAGSWSWACDADPQMRTEMVHVGAEHRIADDVSVDQEHPGAAADVQAHHDDDPQGVDSHAHGAHYELADEPHLRWSDPERGVLVVPDEAEGEWTLEVRAHAGAHEVRWIQGPFDVEELAEAELALDPPPEAFAEDAPQRPLRVMSRLVLRGDDGEQKTQLALPALAMQQVKGRLRFAPFALLPTKIERDGHEALASADLPASL